MTRWKIYLKGTLVLDWSPPSRTSASSSAKISKRSSRKKSANSLCQVRKAQSKELHTVIHWPPTICVRHILSPISKSDRKKTNHRGRQLVLHEMLAPSFSQLPVFGTLPGPGGPKAAPVKLHSSSWYGDSKTKADTWSKVVKARLVLIALEKR